MTTPWRDRVSDPTRGFRKTLPDMTPAEHLALIDREALLRELPLVLDDRRCADPRWNQPTPTEAAR